LHRSTASKDVKQKGEESFCIADMERLKKQAKE
jgi:hypothetical protein